MTAREKIAFLDAKRQLVTPHVDAWQANILQKLFENFATGDVTTIPSSVFSELDRKFEGLIVQWVFDPDEIAIRAKLKEQFGFSSLAGEPLKILKRILREERIRTEEEAKLVQDYLSGDYLGWDQDQEKMAKYEVILTTYDRREKK